MFDIDANILAPMMDAGVFGENIQPIYQPRGPCFPFGIDGIFDNEYAALSIEGQEPAYSTLKPVLGVRLAQFPPGWPPSQGDTVTIASTNTTYKVMNVREDGKGWAKLELMTTGQP